jgi:expansin (peptidoglycan-binding protein)
MKIVINKLCPMMIGISVGLISQNVVADSSVHSGEGTFYTYSGGGNCSFPKDDSILTVAMNAADYAGSAACGGLIKVTSQNTGASVIVRVDNQCPECQKGDLDLEQAAFAQIDDIVAGRIPVKWHYIANDQAGDMKLYFKEGSSQWWTAVQVRDHLYPVSKVAYRRSGDSQYIDLPRKPYNYFVADSGFGVGPYDFRVTDFWGQTVEISNVAFKVTTEIETGKQFPVHE